MFLSGILPMSSAVTTSTTASALRLASSESFERLPVAGHGDQIRAARVWLASRVSPARVSPARRRCFPVAVPAQWRRVAVFALALGGWLVLVLAAGVSCLLAGAWRCRFLRVDATVVGLLCAWAAHTALINASATADAIGFLFSFMQLPP